MILLKLKFMRLLIAQIVCMMVIIIMEVLNTLKKDSGNRRWF